MSARRGQRSNNWQGGETRHGDGYPMVWNPGHPRAHSNGYVHKHILVAEAALGKALPPNAKVHHVDEDKKNYRNDNLVICEGNSYHSLIHARTRILRAGGDPNTQKICCRCGLQPRSAFRKQAASYDGLHNTCRRCHAKHENARYHSKRKAVA